MDYLPLRVLLFAPEAGGHARLHPGATKVADGLPVPGEDSTDDDSLRLLDCARAFTLAVNQRRKLREGSVWERPRLAVLRVVDPDNPSRCVHVAPLQPEGLAPYATQTRTELGDGHRAYGEMGEHAVEVRPLEETRPPVARLDHWEGGPLR